MVSFHPLNCLHHIIVLLQQTHEVSPVAQWIGLEIIEQNSNDGEQDLGSSPGFFTSNLMKYQQKADNSPLLMD